MRIEKVPLVLMAATAGVLTTVSQRAVGAVTDVEALPVSVRLSNALVSYLAYIGKTFWPTGLVPYYPYREAVPIALVTACVVVASAATARAQARHWRDGAAPWEHTTRVTPRSARAHANLGVALARQGRDDAAVGHYEKALRLAPSAEAHNNLALALALHDTGRADETVPHALEAVRLQPGEARWHYVAGVILVDALVDAQRPAEAAAQFEAALRIDPGTKAPGARSRNCSGGGTEVPPLRTPLTAVGCCRRRN